MDNLDDGSLEMKLLCKIRAMLNFVQKFEGPKPQS